jgi:hypothetical protein
MPIHFESGNPLQHPTQTLAFAWNAQGRMESHPLALQLYDRFPAAFASFTKQCRAGKIKAGMCWLWQESQPRLLFMVLRESPVGATRLRYVDAALLLIARDYRLYGLESMTFAPLGTQSEWADIQPLMKRWLQPCPLPCVAYLPDPF